MRNIDRLTWLILYIMLISIICAINTLPGQMIDRSTKTDNNFIPYTEHYSMSGTAYTSHEDCINKKWLDGETATGTKAREGIVAINIDIDKDGNALVRSVLELGQTVYVKGQFIEGIFTVEDTGYFRVKYIEGADPKDLVFDTYNLDFYLPTIKQARGFGIQYPIEVYVIGRIKCKNNI